MTSLRHRLFLACLLASPIVPGLAFAQPMDRPPQDGPRDERGPRMEGAMLVVSGDGLAQADPDFAVVRLGATVQAEDAGEAQAQVNAIMQKALEAVKGLDVDEKRVRTTGLSLYPVYDNNPRPDQQNGEPRIVGYRASNVVCVELDDLSKIGNVIDAAIDAGANELQGVDFQLKDDAEAKSTALREAVASARMKAEVLAEAAGMKLGDLIAISEGGTSVRPPEPMYGRMSMMESNTPVQPGQLEVGASVEMRFRLVAN